MADSEQKYSLSFTSIGARRSETVEVARAYVDCLDWTEVRRRIVEDNIISLNKESTRKRVGSELVKRLRMLDTDEMAFLADAVDDDQLAMIWVVICRTYPVLRAFSTNVVAARFSKMVPDVPRTAWTAFVDEESMDHPELAPPYRQVAQAARDQGFWDAPRMPPPRRRLQHNPALSLAPLCDARSRARTVGHRAIPEAGVLL